MEIKLLRKEVHFEFIEQLLKFKEVYGVVLEKGRIFYQKIKSAKELTDDFIIPDMSVKSYVFPAIEKLFSFVKNKDKIHIKNVNFDAIPNMIIIGIRPCDAVGFKNLESIFKISPEDSFFMKRVEKTIIITYSCNKSDNYCFCTSMGGSPGNVQGSDIVLTKTSTGDYITEIITTKGASVISVVSELFEEITIDLQKENYLANVVPTQFDNVDLVGIFDELSSTSIFDEYAMRCIGCNICAFVCPVCTCFDIQDEMNGSRGHRLRCWDSCASKSFTLHASGHNNRPTQGSRWKQRLMHKFFYMPKQIKLNGCVGCGRCSRYCPVDMNIIEQLTNIVINKQKNKVIE
ncbi:MAG: 4Fe-4S dicluster domain-containing protein [Bacteroidales bacterium OttesenSCG-928-I14]|jgi:ferredoxin|nr:4Fe-4S dicluster domain-containing protein [Bacteroidales bacterium OttesenSCG-928-I14]